MQRSRVHPVRSVLLLAACLALAVLAVCLFRHPLDPSFWSVESLQEYIQSFSPYSQLVFFGIQLFSVILAPIPSNVTSMAGGALFGVWTSFFLSAAAITLGSVVVFLLARALGQKRMARYLEKKEGEKYFDLLQSKRDLLLILIFLLPFFPDDLMCILAGLTKISFRRFFVIVLCTRHWGIFASVVLGGSAVDLPLWAIALAAIALLILAALAWKYGERFQSFVLRRIERKKVPENGQKS